MADPSVRERVRSACRARRSFLEGGGTYTLEEAVAHCVTLADALSVFDSTTEDDDGVHPVCCGERATVSSGLLGQKAECQRCGAKIVEATSPLYSPFLERGNAYVTIPSKEFIQRFGERQWLVMHEG